MFKCKDKHIPDHELELSQVPGEPDLLDIALHFTNLQVVEEERQGGLIVCTGFVFKTW